MDGVDLTLVSAKSHSVRPRAQSGRPKVPHITLHRRMENSPIVEPMGFHRVSDRAVHRADLRPYPRCQIQSPENLLRCHTRAWINL